MEQRSQPRARAVLKGEIRYNNGLMRTACVIRDISEDGARLELPGDIALPDHFDLYIEKRQQTRPVKVKRRLGNEVGIVFSDGKARAGSEPAGQHLAERVAQLEADLAVMRQLLSKIASKLSIET